MSYAQLADMLGPFGANERVAALRAGCKTPGSNGVCRGDSIELHGNLQSHPK
jgi:hypothetical protein